MSDNTVRIAFSDIGKENHWQRESQLLARYNQLTPEADAERPAILAELFGEISEVIITPPFGVSRAHMVKIGRKVFINYNAQIGALAPITIGHHTLIGPNVQLQTATHPVDPSERQRWAFWAKPISIGENVWIGANAIICGGVTIGNHSVIGAGSVVTRDVPPCTLVQGNPAVVIRELNPPDETTLYELNP